MTSLFDLPFEEPAPEPIQPDPGPAPAPLRRLWTVSQLTADIRAHLEDRYDELWVEGEISNCRTWQATGHIYFTLKDDGAQIKAVMFRSAARLLRFRTHDGLHVVARARVSVYEPKGEYQLIVEALEPQGLGALQLAFERLKRRLAAEGLFARERKRPLPLLPRKIGVVTSMDGAAVRDIVTVLSQRHPTAHVVIRPTRVQGEGAAEDVARGIRAICRVPGVDVLILARGGGSLEDLQAFNQEAVARAIAACTVPVICGVGHEVDVTIADFVADLRAATPSNAAELVVQRKDEFVGRIDRLQARLVGCVRQRVDRQRLRVQQLAGRRGLAGLEARVALRGRHVADVTHALQRAVRARIAAHARRAADLRARLEACDQRRRLSLAASRLARADSVLHATVRAAHHRHDRRLGTLAGRLANLSPLAVLARGYAVCWDESRTTALRDATAAHVGQRVRVTLARGELACEVTGATSARDS